MQTQNASKRFLLDITTLGKQLSQNSWERLSPEVLQECAILQFWVSLKKWLWLRREFLLFDFAQISVLWKDKAGNILYYVFSCFPMK